MVSLRGHFASENRSLEYCIEHYRDHEVVAAECMARLSHVTEVQQGSRILEIGAAQGSMVIALKRLGFCCEGVEPHGEAVEVARGLAAALDADVGITKGCAEHLPYGDARFDVVIARSVMEHVVDAAAAFQEAFRVMKPGGAFYFSTTCSLCPYQQEIRFFPFFSWYPSRLKTKIMAWAKRRHPGLVGWSQTPAINWFTPWGAERMLKDAGFERVFSTWDVILPPSSRYMKHSVARLALKLIRLGTVTRRIADVLVPAGVHCVAIKSASGKATDCFQA